MRLFIGISLDQHVKFELQHLQEVWLSHAYTFNKTRFDNFHLTLKFLGEIDPSQIDLIMESLEHALMKTQSFEI
jgi:2'-5' RNA ligase